jgi:membrane protein required for colicin V production
VQKLEAVLPSNIEPEVLDRIMGRNQDATTEQAPSEEAPATNAPATNN